MWKRKKNSDLPMGEACFLHVPKDFILNLIRFCTPKEGDLIDILQDKMFVGLGGLGS